MKEFKPRAWQLPIIHGILDNPRVAIWAGMGMGKTSATLTAIDLFRTIEGKKWKTLIIAPFLVAQQTWPDEVLKWAHTQHLTVSPILGTATERKAALRTNADIYTINYENLPWLVDQLQRWNKKWPFKIVVADESTRLKSFRLKQGGQRTQALGRVAFNGIERFIELSGTPAPNGLIDLWGAIWFIDAGRALGRSFKAFCERWFYRTPDGWGFKPHNHSQAEIETRLLDMVVSVRPEDYFDIEKPIEKEVPVKLPKKAKKLYDDMAREMYAEWADHDLLDANGQLDVHRYEVEAMGGGSKTMKCRQFANGAVYVDPERSNAWKEVHDVKVQALKSIIEEAAGAPILCAYNFRSDLERLLKAFPKAKVIDKDPQTIRDWNEGKIPLMFAHPASAGHGLNLQDGGNILVFFSLDWNLEYYEQILERIGPMRQMQSGHNRPVWVYYIMAQGTVDYDIMRRLEAKASTQTSLVKALTLNGREQNHG